MTALAGLIGQLQGDTSGVKLEDVRVVRLPDGKDPDEVVRESPADWEAAIAKAKPLVEYLIDHHAGRFDLKTSSGRIGFVEAVMPAIREIADPLRRDEALGEVRRVSGVEERVLRQVLERPARNPIAAGHRGEADQRRRVAHERRRGPGLARTPCPSATSCGPSRRSNRSCSGSSCWCRTSRCGSSTSSGPEQLPSTLARELYRAIIVQRAPDDAGIRPAFDLVGLLRATRPRDPAPCRWADGRATDRDRRAAEVERLLVDIESIQLRDRDEYIESALSEAERAGDRETIGRLMVEKIQINEARLSLDRRRDQTRLLAGNRR